MKLINIINARQTINLIDGDNVDFELAYLMAKFMKATETAQDIYTSRMKSLFEKYHVEAKDDGQFHIDPCDVTKFNDEAIKLNEQNVDDPGILFPRSLFKNIKIKYSQLYPLLDFINDEE